MAKGGITERIEGLMKLHSDPTRGWTVREIARALGVEVSDRQAIRAALTSSARFTRIGIGLYKLSEQDLRTEL